MRRLLAVCLLALGAVAPSVAVAELECGYLIGTRQTAVRLARLGWSFQDVLRESLNHPNYRNITQGEREFVIRVVQEAYAAPPSATSQLVLGYCQEEVARKNAAKTGGAGPGQGGAPAPAK